MSKVTRLGASLFGTTKNWALCFRKWICRPLSKYASLYALIIAVFAVAYSRMPGQFHHTTVKFERSTIADRAAIKEGLRQIMVDSYRSNNNDGAILKSNEWVANVNDLNLVDFRYDDGRFRGTVRLPRVPELGRSDFDLIGFDGPSDPEFEIEMDCFGKDGLLLSPLPSEGQTVVSVRMTSNTSDKPMHRLASIKNPDGSIVAGLLRIPNLLHNQMVAHVAANEGFPGHASGNCSRMLYLSTVSITTLGYGDILPITTLARTLVAIEAIAGTLVIGFIFQPWQISNSFTERGCQKNERGRPRTG
ncbi:potassium channel family protein [Paludisphaera sp.]|uniref:potassium channel family protein n=1 Tax=Paludisphaera sp. TaxID=2017432 RepID=UPI00301D9DF5